jgi:hypothetical protein
MKKIGLVLLAMFLPAAPAVAEVHWFEDALPGAAEPLADPNAARFGTSFLASTAGARLFDLSLGSNVGLVQPGDRSWSLEGRAAVFSRFDFLSPSFDFQTADFIGGLAYRQVWQFGETEVYGFHQSCHLGDDLARSGLPDVNLSREILRILYWHHWEMVSIYAGPRLIVISDPSWMQGKTGAQAGVQWQHGRLNLALDLQLHGEYRGDTDVTCTAGVSLSPPAARWQQIFQVFAHCGHPSPGQFEGGYENLVGCGMVVVDQGPKADAW